MAYLTRPTDKTVRDEYTRLKTVAPRVGALAKDMRNRWWIGRVTIGENTREASAYLRGAREALQQEGFLR